MKSEIYNFAISILPTKLRGAVDYHVGHHSLFFPWGGPMNGQTARLEAVREIICELQPNVIVETGTYRGTTTEWLAQFGPQVFSVEINERFFEFSRRRLAKKKNVKLTLGNSVDFLKTIAKYERITSGCVVFYIDSHWEDHLPLREEMETIFKEYDSFVAIIDDFKVESDDGYGYDDYGPGKALTLDFLMSCDLPGLAAFFPSTAARSETGDRRGSIFVTASPTVADMLSQLPLLRRWLPTSASRR